jgi:hypothetical protein
MKCAEYRIVNSFEEAIGKRGMLFEVFILANNGYGVKRRLMTANYQRDDRRYLRVTIYDKWGRWVNYFDIYVGKGNDYGNDVNSNTLNQYGTIYTTSRDYAYNHCMSVLKNKMADLRHKANQLHETIYSI